MSDMKQKTIIPEAGIVSIVVTMVMIVVISLIVLGVAEISRNEQRTSLDQHLSTQAYYAAEAGVNDVRGIMNSLVSSGATVQNKTICGNQGSYTLNSTVNAANNVAYTCVLVNANPTSLVYTVGYTSTVIPLNTNGAPVGNLTLAWKVPTGAVSTPVGCYTNAGQLGTFPVATGAGQWGCAYPVVRVDLVNAGAGLVRANWLSHTITAFFVPFNSAVIPNTTTPVARGAVVGAQCNATNCTAVIGGLAGSNYYMRVTTLYRTNSVLTITAGGNPLFNAQATIDSTGKAQDVLRRIVVAVDLTDANAHKIPSAAIITRDSICKRFGVTPGSFNVYDNLTAGGGGNPLCDPASSAGTPLP
jgi:Tfp pilus assembly protein PilX